MSRRVRRIKPGPIRAGVSLGLRRGYAHVSIKPPVIKRVGIRKRIY